MDNKLLYTGLNSQSFSKEKQKRAKQAKEVKDSQSDLVFNASLITKLIDEQRHNISTELSSIITMDMKPEDVKATILGLRLADQKMIILKTKVVNALRRKLKDNERDIRTTKKED